MVDEQGRHESKTQVGAEQRLTHDDHQNEDHHCCDGWNHLSVKTTPSRFHGLLDLSSCCRSHAATALVCVFSAHLRFISAPRI